MNSMTVNKIVGSICAILLVFLLGKWAAESLFHVGSVAHDDGHGEGEVITQAYVIEVEGGGAEAETDEAEDLGAIFAAADAASGEKVFGKCKACHSLEAGVNGTGPSLQAVFDRAAGTEVGFAYSDAMVAYAQPWNAENLYAFLGDVKGTVPGTKMSFPGIKKSADRANLIVYLASLNGKTVDIAPAAPAAEGEATEEGAETEAAAEDTAGEAVAMAGDPEKGKKVFNKCKACHKVEAGANGTGPTLFGIVGRQAGTEEGFKYSDAMIAFAKPWDAATLDQFLGDVKGTVPGTKMSFPGLKKPEDRADIIAYLETLK